MVSDIFISTFINAAYILTSKYYKCVFLQFESKIDIVMFLIKYFKESPGNKTKHKISVKVAVQFIAQELCRNKILFLLLGKHNLFYGSCETFRN